VEVCGGAAGTNGSARQAVEDGVLNNKLERGGAMNGKIALVSAGKYWVEFAVCGKLYKYECWSPYLIEAVVRQARHAPGKALNKVKAMCAVIERAGQ
jgi:hypothetical protein